MTVEIDLDERQIMREVQSVAESVIDDALDAGADYWEQHARKRTGYMSKAVLRAKVRHADGSVEGYLKMLADYAGFQEFGTRYIEGMHLTNGVESAMVRAINHG